MERQKCPVCRERKPKRSCPAVGALICTVCCATKRLVEIQCPPDCVYLASARTHPPAIVQRRQERDVSFIVPLVADLTETQYRLLLMFQSATVKHAASAVPGVRDEDIAAAADAAAATLETARKGIIYEHQAVSVPAQRLTAEFSRHHRRSERTGRRASGTTRARCRDRPAPTRTRCANCRQGARWRRAPDLSQRARIGCSPIRRRAVRLARHKTPQGGGLIITP